MRKRTFLYFFIVLTILCWRTLGSDEARCEQEISMTDIHDRIIIPSSDSWITIESAKEIEYLREWLANTSSDSETRVKLCADIKISDYHFMEDKKSGRIGIYSGKIIVAAYDPLSRRYYRGLQSQETIVHQWEIPSWEELRCKGNLIFDGNGHSISGIYKNVDDENHCALFGECSVSGLKVEDIFIEGRIGYNVALFHNVKEIKNCDSKNVYLVAEQANDVGMIWGSEQRRIAFLNNEELHIYAKNCKHVGGIMGKCEEKTITDCHVDGVIQTDQEGAQYIGGIVGEFQSDNSCSIRKCNSAVEIDGVGMYVGGIAGKCSVLETESQLPIMECKNEGNISVEKDSDSIAVGGIVGRGPVCMNGCVNAGIIESVNGSVGGIIGVMDYGEIINCTNAEMVSILGDKMVAIGGIVGQSVASLQTNSNIYNCLNEETIAGGIAAKGTICGKDESGGLRVENCVDASGRMTAFVSDKPETEIVNCYRVAECDETTLVDCLNEWVLGNHLKHDLIDFYGDEIWSWGMDQNGSVGIEKSYLHPNPTTTPKPLETDVPSPTPESSLVAPTEVDIIPPQSILVTEEGEFHGADGTMPTITASPMQTPQPTVKPEVKREKKYAAPTFSVKKKRAGAQRYLQIKLKKYQGTKVELWVKVGKKAYAKVKLKHTQISKLKKTINLSYSFRKVKVRIWLRTYSIIRGRTKFSEKSIIKAVNV